ncbi:hypothetical protein M3Y97_00223400 [Aphelenchoides bicaudatus]|nr:hypothetical protein M3Y97_00223400 [Aphelenchoides bicaudatus]
MSVEIEANQNCADELPSTSLLPSNNHNNANSTSSSRTRPKTDSNAEPHKVHFNIAEDEKRHNSPFQRAVPSRQKTSTTESPSAIPQNAGLATRLSLAIRRSLRLGPKQRSTADHKTSKEEHRSFRSGDDKNASVHKLHRPAKGTL